MKKAECRGLTLAYTMIRVVKVILILLVDKQVAKKLELICL